MESKAVLFFVACMTKRWFSRAGQSSTHETVHWVFLGYSRIAKIVCFCDQDGRPSEELCFDIEVLRIFQVEILDRSSPIFKPVSSKDVLIFRFCSLNKIYSKQREQWKIDHERRCFSTEKEDPVTASDPAIQPLMFLGWWLYTWRSSAPSGAAVSTKPTYSDLCVSSSKNMRGPNGFGLWEVSWWVLGEWGLCPAMVQPCQLLPEFWSQIMARSEICCGAVV